MSRTLYRPSRRAMSLTLLAATLGLVPAALAAPPSPVPAAKSAPPLPAVRARQTTTFEIKAASGPDYRIFVSAPVGPPPAGGYPVLYVLDANAWFGIAAEVTRLYELEGGPAIVVGVGYTVDTLYSPYGRARDFTLGAPVTGETGVYAGASFGGADKFLTFLETTLRDRIAERYPIDRARQSLFGHSLGGYFVLHALMSRPQAFSAYVAASPAVWWDPARLAADEAAARARPRGAPLPGVLLAAGGDEQRLGAADENLFRRLHAANPTMFGGRPIEQVIAETRASMGKSRMIDNARDFAGRLKALGIPADFVAFENENHRSVVAPSLGRGMPLFFPGAP